jgi:hypothetical protein
VPVSDKCEEVVICDGAVEVGDECVHDAGRAMGLFSVYKGCGGCLALGQSRAASVSESNAPLQQFPEDQGGAD